MHGGHNEVTVFQQCAIEPLSVRSLCSGKHRSFSGFLLQAVILSYGLPLILFGWYLSLALRNCFEIPVCVTGISWDLRQLWIKLWSQPQAFFGVAFPTKLPNSHLPLMPLCFKLIMSLPLSLLMKHSDDDCLRYTIKKIASCTCFGAIWFSSKHTNDLYKMLCFCNRWITKFKNKWTVQCLRGPYWTLGAS